MSASPENSSAVTVRPPHLIQALVGGFNLVASNIYLIILPVALDLLLWFGPHLRVKALMEPSLLDFLTLMRQTSTVDMRVMLDNAEKIWKLYLDQYNLLSALNTLPIGVPSMMAGQMPIQTPLGTPPISELSSSGQFFLGWIGLTLVGFALGSLYFATLAWSSGRQIEIECQDNIPAQLWNKESTGKRVPPMRLGVLAWEFAQVIALVLILLLILMVLMVPTLFLSVLVALISPVASQFVILFVAFSAVWFLAPLLFTPHGIFLCGQSVFHAMRNSTRLVRYLLPSTGLFLLLAIGMSQGLDLLWRTPPDTSWMALVGIFGHAFITTALIAASFIYYSRGLVYIQSVRKLAARIS